MTMMDLGSVKKDFSALISQIQPWTLSHFVMWLDIKVAEYKVFGRMIMGKVSTFIQSVVAVCFGMVYCLRKNKFIFWFLILISGFKLILFAACHHCKSNETCHSFKLMKMTTQIKKKED